MPVPDYQAMLLPVLRSTADGQEHKFPDAADAVVRHFRLSEEDLAQRLPSGRETSVNDRVGWALWYLKRAGLIEKPTRSTFRITQRGRDVLAEGLPALTTSYLMRFPEFAELMRRSRRTSQTPQQAPAAAVTADLSPGEQLEASYLQLRQVLADELLQKLKATTPPFFEKLVVRLLVAMGYGGSEADAGQAVGKSGDGGVDGVIKEDKLGLDVVYVQAKRWEGKVGRPLVQAFAGSLEGFKARKGVMITTSGFTPDAHEYVNRIEKRIVLIDGERLAQLMIDHGVGVADVETYVVKRVDEDQFQSEGVV